MKHVARVVVVVCAALSLLVVPRARAQDPEADFDGFRIPDHTVRTLGVSAAGAFSPYRSGDSFHTVRRQSLYGILAGQFLWERDSDALQQQFDVYSLVRGSRDWERIRWATGSEYDRDEEWDRQTDENWRLSGELRRYFEASPVAVSLAATLFGGYDQSWLKRRGERGAPADTFTYRSDDRVTQRSTRHTATVSVTLGVGHVRDATGIYDACVLESRLRDLGVLARALSPAARQRIAELYYTKPALTRAYERAGKRFWNDVERVLVEDGAIEGPLEAHALLRLMEDLGPVSINSLVMRVYRRRGFFIGPMVQASFDRVDRRANRDSRYVTILADTAFATTYTLSFKDHDSNEYLSVGGQAEYHRPMGPRWQLDAGSRLGFALLHVRSGLDAASSAQLSHLVADRWLAWVSANHARAYHDPDPGRGYSTNSWQVGWEIGADYYIEDHVTLSLSFNSAQGHPYGGVYQRSEQILFSVAYTFLNDFAAPGLITPLPAP